LRKRSAISSGIASLRIHAFADSRWTPPHAVLEQGASRNRQVGAPERALDDAFRDHEVRVGEVERQGTEHSYRIVSLGTQRNDVLDDTISAVENSEVGLGFERELDTVVLAIILDLSTQAGGDRLRPPTWAH